MIQVHKRIKFSRAYEGETLDNIIFIFESQQQEQKNENISLMKSVLENWKPIKLKLFLWKLIEMTKKGTERI